MFLSDKSGFRALKSCRFILSFLLALLVVCAAAAGVRKIEISSYIQPSSPAATAAPGYFRIHGRFGGGIVPRGAAEFLSPLKAKVAADQLELVILDGAKLHNDRPDYDAIGIRWKGDVYQLSAQDDLIYPLMKFIQRGTYIAYTIPEEVDEAYFKKNDLLAVPLSGGYVAKEFKFRCSREIPRGRRFAHDDGGNASQSQSSDHEGSEQG